MRILKNAHTSHIVNRQFFTKIVTLILISWKCIYYHAENKIYENLGNRSKFVISQEKKTHRLLAKYEKKKELVNVNFKYKAQNNVENYAIMNKRDNNNTHKKIKREEPNNVKVYLKCYKERYAKKNGLKKLDCYCEKKLFNSIEKVMKIAEEKNFNMKRIKRIVYKKYGLPLILLSLLPLFGLILPIMFYKNLHLDETEATCEQLFTVDSKKQTKFWGYNHDNCELLPPECILFNYFFFTTLVLLILLFLIYMYIKMSKYKRIKAGMLK
ncbi:Plasmodium exported protein, unknown function [Plasmodium vivax]|uniref:Fam-l protein n=1 Tax=Plasmodium vivax TaxID=5855 RepID=A0A565A663_PLAVI|nr:Plasmodium exported protein, unknown function [Plasmodium vivax]